MLVFHRATVLVRPGSPSLLTGPSIHTSESHLTLRARSQEQHLAKAQTFISGSTWTLLPGLLSNPSNSTLSCLTSLSSTQRFHPRNDPGIPSKQPWRLLLHSWCWVDCQVMLTSLLPCLSQLTHSSLSPHHPAWLKPLESPNGPPHAVLVRSNTLLPSLYINGQQIRPCFSLLEFFSRGWEGGSVSKAVLDALAQGAASHAHHPWLKKKVRGGGVDSQSLRGRQKEPPASWTASQAESAVSGFRRELHSETKATWKLKVRFSDEKTMLPQRQNRYKVPKISSTHGCYCSQSFNMKVYFSCVK